MQIYAPWCGHCQTLEPTYNKLAKHLRGVESLVIAKMDGTNNEHPRAKVSVAACGFDRFPTVFFKLDIITY
jgi:protein disulfide-isomerase A1